MDSTVTPLIPLIGLAYSLWHTDADWRHRSDPSMLPWGTPAAGFYASADNAAIKRHAEQIHNSGVDFIYIDWSNDIDTTPDAPPESSVPAYIEMASRKLAVMYAGISEHPKISIMIGVGNDRMGYTDGKLQKKADQVYDEFVANKTSTNTYQLFDGKPLLIVYTNTPTPFSHGLPPWSDARFTVRFMTGFVSGQPSLLGPGGSSKFDYWSWEDRGPPTFGVYDGKVEAMTVLAAWRAEGPIASPGRRDGQTFLDAWKRARKLKPEVVLAGTFNEWWKSEQPSATESKDVEPSVEFGTKYLDIIREQGALLKTGR